MALGTEHLSALSTIMISLSQCYVDCLKQVAINMPYENIFENQRQNRNKQNCECTPTTGSPAKVFIGTF